MNEKNSLNPRSQTPWRRSKRRTTCRRPSGPTGRARFVASPSTRTTTRKHPGPLGGGGDQGQQLHHADSGVEWKTLANHKANAKRALYWFQKENDLPKRGAPLMPEWRVLRRQLTDLSRQGRLSGLIRYCGMKGIVPKDVNDIVVDDYMRYRGKTTALATDTKARRAIAGLECKPRPEGWPQQLLTEPPLKTHGDWPRWDDFAPSLQKEVAHY